MRRCVPRSRKSKTYMYMPFMYTQWCQCFSLYLKLVIARYGRSLFDRTGTSSTTETCGPSANQLAGLEVPSRHNFISKVTMSSHVVVSRLRDHIRAKAHFIAPLCPGLPPARNARRLTPYTLSALRNKQIGSPCYPSLIPGNRARRAEAGAVSYLWQRRRNNRRSRLVW